MISRAARIVMVLAGSALCWWPLLIEPNLDPPWWAPLLCVALSAFLATALGPADWVWFAVAAPIGAFFGLCAGNRIWWPADPIAGPWVPIGVAVNTALSGVVATAAAIGARRIRPSTKIYRHAARLVLAGCVAFGPVAFVVASPFAAHRIWVNDQIAALRFQSLKNAIQQTASHQKIC